MHRESPNVHFHSDEAEASRPNSYVVLPLGAESPHTSKDAGEQADHENYETCGFGVYTGYHGYLFNPANSFIRPVCKPDLRANPRRLTRVDRLQFKTVGLPNDYFLGKIHRDFLTGRIVLECIEHGFDFDFVDLANRSLIDGSVPEILADEYLFKAVALPNLSYSFQSAFDAENSVDALVKLWNAGQKPINSLADIRKQSIQTPSLEGKPWLIGTYSPSIPLLLTVVLSTLASDDAVFAALAFIAMFSLHVALQCNAAVSLRKERWFTSILRIAVIAWIWSLGLTPPMRRFKPITDSTFPGVVRIICCLILVIDFVIGDIGRIVTHWLRREAFTIRTQLTEKVTICQTRSRKSSVVYSEAILGQDLFKEQGNGTRFVLIVDAEGMLLKLEPIVIGDLPLPAETFAPLSMHSMSVFAITK